ncbi:MAG TPA: DUF1707 domain-containing protein [Mycobacteriales bacterium]|nr:DUF1707 domain-containing protein [Mycobacteriales bacterium]
MDDERSDELSLRVSDAEREAVVARLGDACGEGRITLDEFTDRTDAVYAARTRGELAQVTADLPESGSPTAPAVRPVAGRAVTGRRRRRIAILSGLELKGRWRVDPESTVVCVFGGAELDLRKAELGAHQVLIKIITVFGGASVVVPHGVHVDVDGVNVLGGSSVNQPDTPPLAGAPTIVIRTVNVLGGTSVEFG